MTRAPKAKVLEADLPTRRFGHYEVLSLLGKGGMASVYLARELEGERAGRKVAIKRLHPQLAHDPEYVALFRREAELSTLLQHPNIVTVYETGSVEHLLFIAMELVDGRDLSHILRRCKERGIQLPIDFAVYLCKILLDALEGAHTAKGPDGRELSLVHCDVSPSNLFISRIGEIKLGDFGIASARLGGEQAQAMVAGKPYYVSPELLEGKISHAADLWASAVTLYELLTLDRPFQGKTPTEVFNAIRQRRWKPLRTMRPDAPPALASVLEKALHRNPSQRFPTAAAFAHALQPHYDERIGTALAIAAVVRGLFGTEDPA